MDLNNTLLALQMLNGVRLYEVRILGTTQYLSYKSREELTPNTPVLVQTKHTFVAGMVHKEVTDFDYSIVAEWKWIVAKLETNPEETQMLFEKADVAAKQKIAQAQALAEAKKILEATGLTLEDMKLLGSTTN